LRENFAILQEGRQLLTLPRPLFRCPRPPKGLRAKPEMKTLLIALKYAIAVVAAVVLDLSVYFVVVPSADNN